jgi:large subunit ribosomal protein L24
VIVEGARMIKKHMKKSQQNPQGAIVEREGTIHISNVMKAEEFDARAAKRAAPATETKA